jgi:hypothetical protein
MYSAFCEQLMKPEQIEEVKSCMSRASQGRPKFQSSREYLIMEDPSNTTHGLEDFMNVKHDKEWHEKTMEKQTESIEAEMRKLAEDLHLAVMLCTSDGEITHAFNSHLHYLTLMDGIKENLQPLDDSFMITDVGKLHASLEDLAKEVLEFVDYVIYGCAKEKEYTNGVRDKGRPAVSFGYFQYHAKAAQAKLR